MNKLDPYEIKTARLRLNAVTVQDCRPYYVQWLNDPDVNRYLETRWTEQDQDTILQFVKAMQRDPANYLFAIRIADSAQHIGNLKIGPINFNHLYADLSYFIGNREAWGKGFATEAINGAIAFAFDQLNLRRLNAGVYSGNVASAHVLTKCGFVQEGVAKEKFCLDDHFEDHLMFGLTNKMCRLKNP